MRDARRNETERALFSCQIADVRHRKASADDVETQLPKKPPLVPPPSAPVAWNGMATHRGTIDLHDDGVKFFEKKSALVEMMYAAPR